MKLSNFLGQEKFVLLYFLFFSYENGRITQKGDGQSTCGASINKAQESDNGKWTCQISVMDTTNNPYTSTADINVTVSSVYSFGKIL